MWSDSLELELQAVGSYLVWVLEPNLCPLQEQHMLLTAKQSLSSVSFLELSIKKKICVCKETGEIYQVYVYI